METVLAASATDASFSTVDVGMALTLVVEEVPLSVLHPHSSSVSLRGGLTSMHSMDTVEVMVPSAVSALESRPIASHDLEAQAELHADQQIGIIQLISFACVSPCLTQLVL